ncbi:WxL domain-containing protein [Listeria booriae]|uniref:leucine-rich repeat domain-containing protein n=1 Tax=Listeria booriae TaxID=1552123 RepID=UPI0028805C37|nr:WxL domain-containing protein [Listeria booriae]MDT0110841.1 WxL domain-containing protein [Listeria booriae]
MKKKMLALMLLFMIPAPMFTDAVKATAPASEETISETQTATEPTKKAQSLKTTKLDTDIVSSADLGNQTWLINEVARQIPAKTIGTTLTFGDLKTITTISLNNNPNVTGSIPPGIQYFSNLTVLSLYENNLSGEIPPELGSLSNLEQLNIRDNKLTGQIPKELGNLTNLRSELSLANNQLTGSIPSELGNLTSFTGAMAFSGNPLTGKIPDSFKQLTKTSSFQFQRTQLTGVFPLELLQSAAVTYLDVSYTQLVSPVETPAKGNFTQTISNNQLAVSVKPTIYKGENDTTFKPFDSASPMNSEFKLINKQAQNAEVALYDSHTVQIVDNAKNQIVYDGPISPAVTLDLNGTSNQFTFYLDGATQNTAALGQVNVISNIVQPADFDNQTWLMDEIERQIPDKKIGSTMTFDDLKQITKIELYSTSYTGHIPSGIQYLTELTELTIANSKLTGSIPASIGNLNHLTSLILASNQLQGEIPESIGSLINVTVLNLSNNQLTGTIPPSIGNLENMLALYLNGNQLSGTLPSSLGNLTSLFNLLLYDNNLSGELPEELGNLVQLRAAFLNDNHFSGEIPTNFAASATVQSVILDNNDFIGIIPSQLYKLSYWTINNNQVTINSASPLDNLTSSGGDTRYENTFLTNSKLAGISSTITDAKNITPFNPASDTYFDLHYTNDGSTREELNTAHQVTIINTDTNKVVYEGTMDPDASFTQVGTVNYQVILDNAPENPNNTINITVQQKALTLTSVPDFLNFGTQKIASSTQTYQRADADWEIVVDDNRKAKHDWALTASIAAPMKGTNGQILADGLIYKDSNGTETPLTKQALAVYNYHPTEDTPDTTKIKWADDEGILLKVKAGEAYAQEYQGQVEWSLVDAP